MSLWTRSWHTSTNWTTHARPSISGIPGQCPRHRDSGGARRAAYKEEFLAQVLDLPNGMPRRDVFRRVLMTVEPAAFQACFVNWLRSLREEATAQTGLERPILPIDGKTLRRSHDHNHGLGPLHLVSIWASEYGLSLGQMACAEKSNEITAIPQLLRLVDIKGGIITIDAMGTQKAIAEQIIGKTYPSAIPLDTYGGSERAARVREVGLPARPNRSCESRILPESARSLTMRSLWSQAAFEPTDQHDVLPLC